SRRRPAGYRRREGNGEAAARLPELLRLLGLSARVSVDVDSCADRLLVGVRPRRAAGAPSARALLARGVRAAGRAERPVRDALRLLPLQRALRSAVLLVRRPRS